MERLDLELTRRQLYLRAARNLGFPERQAAFLTVWRWLARAREETKERVVRSEPATVTGGPEAGRIAKPGEATPPGAAQKQLLHELLACLLRRPSAGY